MIKAASASRHGGGGGGAEEDDGDVPSSVEEVEMGLLAHDEHASSSRESFADADGDRSDGLEGEDVGVRLAAAVRRGGYDGFHGDGLAGEAAMKAPLTREDKKAMALLIVLCASSSSLAFHHHPVCVYRPVVVADFSPAAKCCVVTSFRAFVSAVRYHPGRPGEFCSSAHTRRRRVRAYQHGGRSSSFTYRLPLLLQARLSSGCVRIYPSVYLFWPSSPERYHVTR